MDCCKSDLSAQPLRQRAQNGYLDMSVQGHTTAHQPRPQSLSAFIVGRQLQRRRFVGQAGNFCLAWDVAEQQGK